MALIKVKVGEKVYELDRLTLGDGAVLKRRFGVTDLDKFDPRDPETLLGLITLAVSKARGIPIADAEKVAGDFDLADISGVEDEPEPDPTPAEAPVVAATVDPDTSGSSETTLPEPGIQP